MIEQTSDRLKAEEKPDMHDKHRRVVAPVEPVTRKKLDQVIAEPEEDMAGPSLSLFIQEPADGESDSDESDNSEADIRDYKRVPRKNENVVSADLAAPISHQIQLDSHSKAVLAISVDPEG